ncbi:hypothetical protein [Aerococcus urinaeequi]|nr:hypothetical protein [Aerococcus urinaeequi]
MADFPSLNIDLAQKILKKRQEMQFEKIKQLKVYGKKKNTFV